MITVGRDTCRNLEEALTREWLVTNGIGGYASGTVAGVHTRRYHGLLVAAVRPPRERKVMLVRVDEEVVVDDRTFYLGASEYHDGTIHPNGYIHLQECRVEDGIPTFVYEVPGVTLTKTIWMEDGFNTTYVRYVVETGSQPVTLRTVLFTTYRDFHSETHGAPDWVFAVQDLPDGVEIRATAEAMPLWVRTQPTVPFIQTGVWYWRYLHRRERDRGLDFLEDLYTPGLFTATVEPGEALTIQASADHWPDPVLDAVGALNRRRERQRKLWASAPIETDDSDIRDLVVAADQFVVRAEQSVNSEVGIITGYHWFCEWGRDTLISLPGLLLGNGRLDLARDILRRYATLVDHGDIPNRLPDEATLPEYNSIDASLWYFQAIEHYLDVSRDDSFLAELFPTLSEIVRWYERGTRFGVGVDENDGLLAGGSVGVQLTWMDAKVGDWVVTPRRGKPVEINALWYNVLRLMDGWSRRLGHPGDHYRDAARRVYESFNRRFWYADGGYLFDVVDCQAGEADDASFRPNQIFAIGLLYPTLDPRRWDAVLDKVDEKLLTPFGLRTLAPDSPHYVGRFFGDQARRDGAYHQGTVWPWLIGTYADACRRSGRDLTRLRQTLNQLTRGLGDHGLGTIGEVFDGDFPHSPGGCIAQAWSVAEVLRASRRHGQE